MCRYAPVPDGTTYHKSSPIVLPVQDGRIHHQWHQSNPCRSLSDVVRLVECQLYQLPDCRARILSISFEWVSLPKGNSDMCLFVRLKVLLLASGIQW